MSATHPMSPLDDDTLARLGHLNYIEFSRELVRESGRSGVITEEDGLVLHASRSPCPVLFNAVWRIDPKVAAEEVIERADRWFAARQRGYTITLRDELAEDEDLRAAALAAGLVPLMTPPEMVCRQRVEDRPLPAGAHLRWVHDQATLADFCAVNDEAYASLGLPRGTIYEALTSVEQFTADHVRTVVAYLDDRPVAAAQTILSHGIAGVYWVGTVDEARGSGLGDAVTRAVTNRAFDEGARANTLQASPFGEKIYARMGYETLFRYTGLVRLEPVT